MNTRRMEETTEDNAHDKKIDGGINIDDDTDSVDSVDSVDEALMEMLGISSFQTKEVSSDTNTSTDTSTDTSTSTDINTSNNNQGQKQQQKQNSYPNLSNEEMKGITHATNLKNIYEQESICIFPSNFSIPSQTMRRLTDELIYGSSKYQADRSYENIQFIKNGAIGSRRVLTRLENFVSNHPGWYDLCYNYISHCISVLMGEEMVLFKEKLNLKPPGGSGFAPHLDEPSLHVAFGSGSGAGGGDDDDDDDDDEKRNNRPQSFVTVMVAIDDMTSSNGCLKVCKGPWSEDNHCEVIIPDEQNNKNSNPDAEGRRGAIPSNVANEQEYDDIIIKGGTIAAFNGWAPHRSVANTSPFPRRAIFLTYNRLQEGDFRELYYERMNKLRSDHRNRSLGIPETNGAAYEIEKDELAALASIPR